MYLIIIIMTVKSWFFFGIALTFFNDIIRSRKTLFVEFEMRNMIIFRIINNVLSKENETVTVYILLCVMKTHTCSVFILVFCGA